MVPSFRYLIAKGRDDEARAILTKHHAAGHDNSTLVDLEVTQIRDAVRTATNTEKRPSLGKMLTSPANRRRLLISTLVAIAAQWSGNTVISYYLVLVLNGIGVTNATHQSLINGGLQIFNLLATVGCGAMLVDVLGRRRLFQWSAIGMTLSYMVCIFLWYLRLDDTNQHLSDLDYSQRPIRRNWVLELRLRRYSNAFRLLLPLRHRPDTSAV